ncbi:hypothetical protein DV515_00009248 [Chloebia gouldiae]|uniref:Uncharacterized protein n=1 Tax=Chloebia gouldiae TaxID=44316 RepID=A0A3L8SCF9_CHLGU|nr:hypothetical protein DV515_00009248 [Chloebia gouldiae]
MQRLATSYIEQKIIFPTHYLGWQHRSVDSYAKSKKLGNPGFWCSPAMSPWCFVGKDQGRLSSGHGVPTSHIAKPNTHGANLRALGSKEIATSFKTDAIKNKTKQKNQNKKPQPPPPKSPQTLFIRVEEIKCIVWNNHIPENKKTDKEMKEMINSILEIECLEADLCFFLMTGLNTQIFFTAAESYTDVQTMAELLGVIPQLSCSGCFRDFVVHFSSTSVG